MALHERYTGEIRRQLNYLATWMPTVHLRAGDVCNLRGNELTVVGRLFDFSIDFEVEDGPVKTDIVYTSEGAVSVQVKLDGQPPPTGSMLEVKEAGIAVSFARKNAIALVLASCSSKRLASQTEVGAQVLHLYNQGKWPADRAVVTEVIEAQASTILVSNHDNAGLDLLAAGQIAPGTLSLASLDAKLSVKSELRIGARFVSKLGLTPLARVSGIKRRFLGPDMYRGTAAQNVFDGVDYTDYATHTT